jgi:Protein of unknown function with PCYCGC motif
MPNGLMSGATLEMILLLAATLRLGIPIKGPAQTSTLRGDCTRSSASQHAQACERRKPSSSTSLAYHDEPPTEPVPATLSPAQFARNKAAFVTYSIARKIRDILYQEPCYCPCVRERKHKSLLDCFMDQHGVWCEICHKEAIFAYEQAKLGKTPAEIRVALEKGDAWKVDVKRYAEERYALFTH